MFGKRKQAPAAPVGQASSDGGGSGGGDGSTDSVRFPWSDDPSATACNLACGNIGHNLVDWVAREGRVHAETYVAVAGAIAGYAAQQTLLAQEGEPGGLQIMTTQAGDKYLFGDALNYLLVPRTREEAVGKVWSHAAGGAVTAGLAEDRVPSWEEMFRHVAGTIGGPLDGRPSTGEGHQPGVTTRQALAIFWPRVATFFKADFDDIHRRFGPVPQKWWAAIAAFNTAKPIIDVKDALEPAIALTILMESAIYASKVLKF